MIISRTPLRICIAGGGTDLPSFYENNGGFVISLAINKYIYLTYKPDYFEKQLKLRYSQIEIVDDVSQLKNHRAKAVLKLHNIYNSCEINSCADIPSNTGLGSSGSFLVGLSNCVREFRRIDKSPAVLAEEACNIEINQLREPVGKQDQYIAAYGGLKLLKIYESGAVSVGTLNLNYSELQRLISNIGIYYLNIKRDASDILSEQKMLKGNTEELLKTIKFQAEETFHALEKGNFDDYGMSLDVYWNLKKQLSSKISVPVVDQLYDVVRKEYGVLGGKIIGAGGGGFIMLYCPKNQKALDLYMSAKGFPRLDFNVDNHGSMILGNFTN